MKLKAVEQMLLERDNYELLQTPYLSEVVAILVPFTWLLCPMIRDQPNSRRKMRDFMGGF